MNLIAGSYEKFIWGFKLKQLKSTSETPFQLQSIFSYPSHFAPITTIAIAGSVVVSGSSDDTIQLYDISAATSLGCIHHHTSSITSLSLFLLPHIPSPCNLLAATGGGEVLIFDTDPFVLLKTIKHVHKREVNDLAVHPSGKLALTVGRDKCFSLVNLVRGKRSFCCRLEKEAGLVKFDALGDKFYMVLGDTIGVHESEDARLISSFECTKSVLCAAPGSDGLLFIGGEDRSITAWDTHSSKAAYRIEDAHASRVKGIVVNTTNDMADPYLIVSASSDGVVRVWDVRVIPNGKRTPLAEASTKSRLTCLAGSSSLKSMFL